MAKLQAWAGSRALLMTVAQCMSQSLCSVMPLLCRQPRRTLAWAETSSSSQATETPARAALWMSLARQEVRLGAVCLLSSFSSLGKCLATTVELRLCCPPAEAMSPGGLVPEITNGE